MNLTYSLNNSDQNWSIVSEFQLKYFFFPVHCIKILYDLDLTKLRGPFLWCFSGSFVYIVPIHCKQKQKSIEKNVLIFPQMK